MAKVRDEVLTWQYVLKLLKTARNFKKGIAQSRKQGIMAKPSNGGSEPETASGPTAKNFLKKVLDTAAAGK